MKSTKSFRILTPVIMAIFILSLFSGVVVAATAGEQYEKANEIYKANKEKYDNTKKKFEEAKDIFEKANKQLGKLNDNQSKEEFKLKAKDYLLRAINFAESQLQVMKSRVENSENKGIIPFDAIKIIDSHTAQLEQLKVKVEKANSTQELRDAHKELKNIVVDINLETRYYMGIMLNHRIDNFITKTDDVNINFTAAITKLKARGNDTTKLEKDVADFNDAVKKAKETQTKTKELYKTHNGFTIDGTVTSEQNARKFLEEGNKLQRETIKDLRNAGNQVIKFIKDLRKLVVSGGLTRTLTAGEVSTTHKTGAVTTTFTATD